jgi:hypothetical protein
MQFSSCRNADIDGWHVAVSIVLEQYPIMTHRVLAKAVADSFDCRSADHALAGVVLPILPLFLITPAMTIRMVCLFWDSQLRRLSLSRMLYRNSGRC